MFEDVKKDDEKIITGSQAKPEDMFDKVDPAPQIQSALQGGRLTPVSGVTGAGQAGAPVSQGSRIGPPDPLTHLSQIDEWSARKPRKGMRTMLIIIVLLIIAGAAGAYYVFSILSKEQAPAVDNANDLINASDLNVNVNAPAEAPEPTTPPQMNTNAMIDSDGDGLTDIEEQTYGTDPNSMDTDSDGISDRDELFVYKTDPLINDTDNDGLSDRDELFVWNTDPRNPDTDGDSYLDGAEVKNNYDPKGPGKLPLNGADQITP